ncbi:MAG: hypothetical protein RBS37_02875 [Bacteroidales bacterium]|jgi:hypothetical protein|nr:hypothetical protein [Bacteroidales bacterium]
MKLRNLLPLLLLAVLMPVAGCKKGPDKLIAKTWKVTTVMSKGTFDEATFQPLKDQLMKVEMTFKDNKYSISVDGNVIETGTYAVEGSKIVVTTEEGMKMDAVVTKETLTLDNPDFMTTLQPK